MRVVLNIIWLIFGGFWSFLAWVAAGIVMCVLIITIPFGIQAFKIAGFTLWPFGRTLVKRPDAGTASTVGNVLWIVLIGWWLAILHLALTITMAVTIVGIPLALGNLKLVTVCLLPFGREVVPIDELGSRHAEAINIGSL